MLRGIKTANALLSWSEVAVLARAGESLDGYPAFFLQMLVNDNASPRPAKPSPSKIAYGALRREVLCSMYDYYERLDDLWPMYRGTWFHAGYDLAMNGLSINSIREKSIHAKLPCGYDLWGRMDCYIPSQGLLLDFKTTNKVPDTMSTPHLVQLAAYKWMLETMEPHTTVKTVGIAYATMFSLKLVTIPVEDDPLLADNIEIAWHLDQATRILLDGFQKGIVPDMAWCTTDKCYYCPVRQQCKEREGADVLLDGSNPATQEEGQPAADSAGEGAVLSVA